MRLGVRLQSPLHVWTVSDYIKQTQANLFKQQTSRFVTMQSIFRKLYLRHLDDYEKLQVHQRNMNNIVLMGQAPAHTIADYFYRKGKFYFEEFMTATFQSIANAYHISKVDNGGSLDTLGYKLFLTAEFCNLSQQLKYGLRHNKVTFNNLVSILNSLLKMQYVDYEIINLVILYTQRQIDGGKQDELLKDWKGDREFQIEKKGYYNPNQLDILKSLREGKEIATALSFIRHIYDEWHQHTQLKNDLARLNIPQMNQLLTEISQTNKNFRQIVQAILNVRTQYVKMVLFSQNEQILRNPSLNLELLQLEEKLLSIRVLNIEDIKHIKEMSNPEYEVKRVEEIILTILDINQIDPIYALVDKNQVEIHNPKDSYVPSAHKVFTLLNLLTKLAALDRFVYHTVQGRSLITLKWQKTLIEQETGLKIHDGPIHEQLNVSRIYRRVYSDVLNLFTRNQTKIDRIFSKSSNDDKIELLDAYCRIGLGEQTIFRLSDLQNQQKQLQIDKLQPERFLTLVHLLNEVGILIKNNTLKQSVFNRLQVLLEEDRNNRTTLSLRSTIDVVNYLLQNYPREGEYSAVYRGFIDRLQLKSVYYPNQGQDNEQITEAFKILGLQMPEKYGLHPTYLNYLYKTVHDSYKKNPYLAILRQTCFKWANKSNSLDEVQPFLNLGISNGIHRALVFSNSDQTNLDGQLRSGDLNAYIFRLERRYGVKVNLFSVNSFLDINFKTKQQAYFKLKPLAQLQKRLQLLFPPQHQNIVTYLHELKLILTSILRHYPQQLITSVIEFKLQVVQQLSQVSTSVETKEQQLTKLAQFVLQTLELGKSVELLREEQADLSISRQTPSEYSINSKNNAQQLQQPAQQQVTLDSIKKQIQQAKHILKQLTSTLRQYIEQQSLTKPQQINTNLHLQGKRQTLELLETEATHTVCVNAAYELINHLYFNDKTYCEYNDWSQKIYHKYNVAEVPYPQLSNLTKILLNKLCSTTPDKVTLMPICKHEQRLKRVNLEFKLIKDQTQSPLHQPKQHKRDLKQLEYIINLQNFKHELKTTFTPKKLLDFIFSFKFIEGLDFKQQNNTPTKQSLLLERNPEEYFNYLQTLSEKQYLQSPYAKYIIQKLTKTTTIKKLLQTRKQLRISQKILFQQGKIDAATYYEAIKRIQDSIIEQTQSLKNKMLDNMPNSLIEGQLKMVHIDRQQLQAFEDIINRQFIYNRFFDQDFIMANGNYQLAINYKRGRAQANLIKFSLLNKLATESVLSDREKDLLKRWSQDVHNNVTQFQVYKDFTKLQISDLSWEDLQLLKLKSSSLNSNKHMLLIDLILELSHFLDQTIIQSLQRQIKADYLHKNYSIPTELFEKSGNMQFRQLQMEIQNSTINKQSSLSQQQLDMIQTMFKTFKTEGYKERNRYNVLCRHFKDNITKMNQQPLRNQLIQEYIKHLENQFFKQYNPELIAEIKQKETDKLWREVFHQSYDSCGRDLLRDTTKKLIIRLQVVGKNSPPFFGNLLLNLMMHPNLDPLSRENIIAAIELNNFDMNLDSQDILLISKHSVSSIRETAHLHQQLQKASSLNLGRLLNNRVSLLV